MEFRHDMRGYREQQRAILSQRDVDERRQAETPSIIYLIEMIDVDVDEEGRLLDVRYVPLRYSSNEEHANQICEEWNLDLYKRNKQTKKVADEDILYPFYRPYEICEV